MPEPVDVHRPLPDEAHEAIRLGVVQALNDLADSLMLVDTLFALSDGSRADIGTGQADMGDSLLLVDALFGLVDALTARVAAVEAALPVPAPEQPGGLL